MKCVTLFLLTLTRRKFIAGAPLLMGLNQTADSKEIIDIVQSRELTRLLYSKSETITTEIYVNVNKIKCAKTVLSSSLFDQPMKIFLHEVTLFTQTLLDE